MIYNLANNYSIILLNGDGFASSQWSLRVSLANLRDDSYFIIGKSLKNMIDDLSYEWKNKLELSM